MKRIETKNATGKVFCITSFDEENNWIYADWKGYVTPEDIKTWSEDYLKILSSTKCENFLNNNKDLTGPWQKANEWIATDLTPRVIYAGLRNYAHIVSPSIFGEMSATDLLKKVEGVGFTMRTFKEMSEAEAWLKSLAVVKQ